MSDQTIEQRLDASLRDVFFKGRTSMQLEIETKGRAILMPIASEIEPSKATLLQLLNEARIDEVKNDSIVWPLIGGSLVFTSSELRRLTKLTKADRIAQLTPRKNKQ